MVPAPDTSDAAPRVMPFMSHDGPRLSIEADDRNRRHRLLLPPELRVSLISMLRRAQHGETKIHDRPLSINRVRSTAMSGDVDRYLVVQFHERVPGNGVRLHRLPVRDDAVPMLLAQLWDADGGRSGVPSVTLESFANR